MVASLTIRPYLFVARARATIALRLCTVGFVDVAPPVAGTACDLHGDPTCGLAFVAIEFEVACMVALGTGSHCLGLFFF